MFAFAARVLIIVHLVRNVLTLDSRSITLNIVFNKSEKSGGNQGNMRNFIRFILGLIPGIGMLFFMAIMFDLCHKRDWIRYAFIISIAHVGYLVYIFFKIQI